MMVNRDKKKKKVEELKAWDDFRSTEELETPEQLVDQIVGQENAVDIIRKAARQRRNVLLIGDPGTGKSMLGQAMAELLPMGELQDVLIIANQEDENNPKVAVAKAGEGSKIVKKAKTSAVGGNSKTGVWMISLMVLMYPWFLYWATSISPTIIAAQMIVSIVLVAVFVLGTRLLPKHDGDVPKLLINNAGTKKSPFIEATGAHAGALLGDVKHDPLQSGGLGTPPHLRVIPGLIHKANRGVLFIDEIGTMSIKVQHDLLTAMQEGKFHITGRSEMSSGAMVMTDPVPCDLVLIAAGNLESLKNLHPALRSRIEGYGYEIYMNQAMDDTEGNRRKIAQFIAQEVKKDKKIAHFSADAVREILKQSKRREGRKGKITLRLRELGGLVRAAGDIALEKGHALVTADDVKKASVTARTLEEQLADRYVERRREYEVIKNTGNEVGRVNGLAVIGNGGIVLPIVAEVTAAQSKSKGSVIATGKLGDIAKEAVRNVSAIVKKRMGHDITNYDIHVQFLQTYEGVEGDSASVSVAVAVLSALKSVPVKQQVAMTGSLDVRGDVLPVGGVTQKIIAAINAGMKEVVIPYANRDDVILDKEEKKKIKINLAKTIDDVMKYVFSRAVSFRVRTV